MSRILGCLDAWMPGCLDASPYAASVCDLSAWAAPRPATLPCRMGVARHGVDKNINAERAEPIKQ
ncbi:MAG: hypothetical protein ACN6PV_13340, partial [Achromobacter sp.]|uniref:hypothetical protein n=1 Tax=Achromobacter sp. TaxID=134375 RepID=UPI003D010B92